MLAFAKVIMYTSIFSAVLPLFLLIINWHRVRHRYFSFLGLLICISFAIDIVSIVGIALNQAASYLLNIQDMLQFILLILIYREFYLKNKRSILFFMIISYFVFEAGNTLFFQNLSSHQTWTWTFSGMILIGAAIGYYLDMLKKLEVDNILIHSPLWINAAVIFYFTLSLYIFLKADFVFRNASPNYSTVFWGFHDFNNIIKNCLFAVGVYFMGSAAPSLSKPMHLKS